MLGRDTPSSASSSPSFTPSQPRDSRSPNVLYTPGNEDFRKGHPGEKDKTVGKNVDKTEANKILENARSLVEFAQSCLKSNAERLNSDEHINKRALDQVKKTQKQIEDFGLRSNGRVDVETNSQSEPLIPDSIDYLEVSTLDLSPLSVLQVQTYFARFGALVWCLQAGNAYTVIFKFVYDKMYKFVLTHGHHIEQRPLALQAMKNGGVPLGRPSIAEPGGDLSARLTMSIG